MSQAKVDRYKKEKKNRSRDLKLQKAKKALIVFILALAFGALIGIPLGKAIYKYEKKKAEEHATISSLHYSEWFDNYWVENYADFFVGNTYTSEEATEAPAEDVTEADTTTEGEAATVDNGEAEVGAEAIEADPIEEPSVD